MADTVMTKSEFALSNSWSKSYVSKLGKEGRLVLTDDGRVMVEDSLARIAATTGAIARASDPALTPVARADRDRKDFYDAENARLDLEERLGALCVRKEVVHIVADTATRVRAALEGWPARLAPQLAAIGGSEARITALLRDEVEEVLSNMALSFQRLAEEGDGAHDN